MIKTGEPEPVFVNICQCCDKNPVVKQCNNCKSGYCEECASDWFSYCDTCDGQICDCCKYECEFCGETICTGCRSLENWIKSDCCDFDCCKNCQEEKLKVLDNKYLCSDHYPEFYKKWYEKIWGKPVPLIKFYQKRV